MLQNKMPEQKILFIGDIIGAIGRRITREILPGIIERYAPDFIIANGENSAHGYGITPKIYNDLIDMGIDAVSMGNHVWDKKEVIKDIDKYPNMVRPANYPKGTPGKEYFISESKGGAKIALVNLIGRVFMPPMDCPFQRVESLVPEIKKETNIIIVDIHAEATSEKSAMGLFLDGRATAVLGTHTHVMTADDRILPNGTAYITDAGMVGAADSIIGMNKEQILKKFVTGMPEKFEPTEAGPGIFNAVLITVDTSSGHAKKIEKIIKATI